LGQLPKNNYCMTQTKTPKSKLRLPAQGLMMQLITIVLLPLTVILLVITFGSLTVHQQAMRSMVGERDARLVSSAASALNAQIELRSKELIGLAQMLAANTSEPISSTLSKADFLLPDFDQGLAIFDAHGNLLYTRGNSQMLETLAASENWQTVYSELLAQPGKLKVVISPINNSTMGVISLPFGGENLVVGAFSIPTLAESTLVNILPSGTQLSTLLVDANQQVLYKAGDTKDYSIDHPGIAQALQGQSGTVYVNAGRDEHVTAYSPVVLTGWALVTEESWEAVSTPTLRLTQIAPLVMVPALLIMLLALWLGTRQIIQPLRTLESKAATLAAGDFNSIQEPVGGIAEIQHLQNELIVMSHKVQEAQRSLHGYIGAITSAQEEERYRLARELHDDTLQALIALQQRVQLAQLEVGSSANQAIPESIKLKEIAVLTEQTIENLRRLTRALRPIYLEDLGLVPALEMLARETGQGMDNAVEFHCQGVEKRLEPSIELAFYRMAQEALSNISRHAQARHATLSISFTSTATIMQIVDDGVGFEVPKNPAEYAPSGHYGLLGLHERAELIGATLQIRSSAGKGTSLTVTFPVRSPTVN
jgi:signal transduction histidine kinase